jgi:hypothetical protein
LSIRDFLIGTAIAALSITLVQFVPDNRDEVNADFWTGWAIAALFIAAAGMFLVAPLMVVTLRLRDLSLAIFTSIPYAVAGPAAFTALLAAIFPGLTRDSDFPMIPIALVSCALALTVPLWIVRAAGYRLRIGSK